MDPAEEANQLKNALTDLINRYAKECEGLTVLQVVGILEAIKINLLDELRDADE